MLVSRALNILYPMLHFSLCYMRLQFSLVICSISINHFIISTTTIANTWLNLSCTIATMLLGYLGCFYYSCGSSCVLTDVSGSLRVSSSGLFVEKLGLSGFVFTIFFNYEDKASGFKPLSLSL